MSGNPLSEAANKGLAAAIDNVNTLGAGIGAAQSLAAALGDALVSEFR